VIEAFALFVIILGVVIICLFVLVGVCMVLFPTLAAVIFVGTRPKK
jgi:hypothetical protein